MKREPKVKERLPIHGGVDGKEFRNYALRIDGMVEKCLTLTLTDLELLPQEELIEDFSCREGWKVPNLRWRGILLETVVSLARPHPDARHVQASAGDFSISVSRDRAAQALLALRLNASQLASEHGGPIRLVVPGGDCFTSIKWLDHLELRSEPGPNTAETIALGRLSPQPSRRG